MVRNLTENTRSTIQKRDSKGVIRHGAEWLTLWSDPDSLKTEAEKRNDVEIHCARLDIEHRLQAAARSISGHPDLQIEFASDPRSKTNLTAMRGEVDSYALLRRFHSAETHRQFYPAHADTCRLFDLCERVRCEALGASRFPGVGMNIVAHHMDRLEESDLLNAHLASLVPLGEGLRMVLRDTLLAWTEPSIPSSAFWMWDRWIRARFSADLRALHATQHEEASFAPLSLQFIHDLLKELGSTLEGERRFQPTGNRLRSEDDPGGDRIVDQTPENPKEVLLEPGGGLFLEGHAHSLITPVEPFSPDAPPYSPFTVAHDRIVRAKDLVNMVQILKARAELDQHRADYRRDFLRLITKLQRKLLARQQRNWSFDLEEGLVDASRLDQVIVNPSFTSAFKKEQESEFRDSVVSILIDNSGSMRGKPIEIACLTSEMIAAALERCNVACEILGFTTSGWSGGDSARDWVRAGRPPDPGRLNDLLHIIYKSAGEPVRRSRPSICAMLDPSLLKENVDGEALLWASRRLLLRPERRKILIVISDGAPVDQATIESNSDKQILDRHLRQSITFIEKSRSIELTAIGVKHVVSGYYSNSTRIDSVANLGASLVSMVDRLLLAP